MAGAREIGKNWPKACLPQVVAATGFDAAMD
jgi:hypothetical protein